MTADWTDAAVDALVAEVRSRGEIKRLGARIDGDAALRAAVERRAAALGHDSTRSGKHLVRMLRDRESESRVRTNPIHIDEPFTCLHCGAAVSAGGERIRDHCPTCLRSRHLDVVPGDRAAGCGGLLDPVRFELDHGAVVIHYTCRRCGQAWRGRAHPDDAVPPDLNPASIRG